ncbi:MAG: transporter substrate-binding domain-containing protein, partial [Synergistaceae bacterium]|nr:transporter substrate-binding domain-containing protein [Synergistaceae bacterium]
MKFFGCRKFAGILLLLALTCGGCTGNSKIAQKQPITSIQQLNDPACTIAVSEAGPAYEAVKRDLPKAKRLYLMGQPAYDAVRSGKADAYADGRTPIDVAVANGLSGVKILPDKIGDPIDIAVGISKNSKYPGLKDKINTFIAELKANGTLQDMYQRWAVDRNFTMPDIPLQEKADTKLVVGTTGLVMPFTYYEGTTLTGYDIELSRRFAQWLGAELEFKVYNFGGILPAAAAGEVDCLMSNLFVTPERKERMDFSDPIYIESVALMVKDDDAVSVSEASEEKGYYSLSDLDGKRIGVFTGAIHDKMVKKVLPKAECVYFDSIANALSAVTSGKIEAVAIDEQIVKAVEQENSSVRPIDGYLQSFENAFITAKTPEGDKIRTQLNEFIRSLKSDGTLQQIQKIWEGTDESKKTLPDYKNYPDTNGTIRIAAENETPPFSYIKDGRLVGYEI